MSLATVIWAVAAAGSTAVLVMAQMNIPNASFWADRSFLIYVSILVVALLALEEILRRAARALFERNIRRYEKDIRVVLSAGLRAVADNTGVGWEQVGVHAFLARGIRKRLINIGGLRLGARPSLARSNWRPGRGVAGRAWQLEMCVAEDWATFVHYAFSIGKTSWERLSNHDRYGVSWAEVQLTADYSGVVAQPIYSADGVLIGCVTIDAPLPVDALTGDPMLRVLRDVAAGVASAGSPPSSWWANAK